MKCRYAGCVRSEKQKQEIIDVVMVSLQWTWTIPKHINMEDEFWRIFKLIVTTEWFAHYWKINLESSFNWSQIFLMISCYVNTFVHWWFFRFPAPTLRVPGPTWWWLLKWNLVVGSTLISSQVSLEGDLVPRGPTFLLCLGERIILLVILVARHFS